MDSFCENCGKPPGADCARAGHVVVILGEERALIRAPGLVRSDGPRHYDDSQGPTIDEGQDFFPVPSDEVFEMAGSEFYHDGQLDRLAADVVNAYPEDFGFILQFNFEVAVVWKRKGGNSGGRMTLGKCVKPTAMVRHFMKTAEADADILIWIAADHCRGRLNRKKMEALMFHEFKHIGIDDKNKPKLRPHDFQGFAREIEEFGAWSSDISAIARAVKLSNIFDEEED